MFYLDSVSCTSDCTTPDSYRSPCLGKQQQQVALDTEHLTNTNFSAVVGGLWCLWFMASGVKLNIDVFSFYRNPDLDNRIFVYLLTLMAAMQAEDERDSFLFVGHLNCHHQEAIHSWSLDSTTTNRHGVTAFDFATVSGRNQLVVGLKYARGITLDLIINVPDLVRCAVLAPTRKTDHSSLSAVILMKQAFPNLCVSRKVFLKCQVNRNTVCGAMQNLP